MTLQRSLSFTSIQAPIQDFIVEDLAAFVATRMDIPVQFLGDRPWQERERSIDRGDVDVAWICGLPYAVRADGGKPDIELLAAPVMEGDRYQDRPIYFSDVIVQADSDFQSFDDLHGATWAFNEPGSHSGYNITRYHLAASNKPTPFFGRVVEAGSHQRCIQLLLEGEIDAAAIDTTVLDLSREQDHRIDQHLRVLTTLGPSPIPPLVISRRLDPSLRDSIRALILSMHQDRIGSGLLKRGKIRRFQDVNDSDYDVIREMAQEAHHIDW